ncbi:hypothetical protein AVEN_166024-1 [Araneus ventricosus]|uniref:Uncharacterized protein n=1 Tax=Araneus ventricosus TaxID=182803 RepID=A0A4Y2L4U8_ARAVE|nr:hypothetical protein AVEN_166024-1 [Araneus ventricosus]
MPQWRYCSLTITGCYLRLIYFPRYEHLLRSNTGHVEAEILPPLKTYRVDKGGFHTGIQHHALRIRHRNVKNFAEWFDFWVRPICLPSPMWVETSGSFCTPSDGEILVKQRGF